MELPQGFLWQTSCRPSPLSFLRLATSQKGALPVKPLACIDKTSLEMHSQKAKLLAGASS